MKIQRVCAKNQTSPLKPNSTGPNTLLWISHVLWSSVCVCCVVGREDCSDTQGQAPRKQEVGETWEASGLEKGSVSKDLSS